MTVTSVMRPTHFRSCVVRVSRVLGPAGAALASQRRMLRYEVLAVKGLMPLLMKSRNGERWTREDRQRLRAGLKGLSVASPCLVVLVMPGGFLLLPLLAWWLDRRARRRSEAAAWRAPGEPGRGS